MAIVLLFVCPHRTAPLDFALPSLLQPDSDNEKPESSSSMKAKIYRLFGREKPVHQVLGGGKRPVRVREKSKCLKMARNAGEEAANVDAGIAEARRVHRRSRGPDVFLILCRCFSFITSLTAILCIGVNVLSAIRSFKHGSAVFDGIFRCYAVLIAAFVVLAETEWEFIIKFSKVMEYWVARGMLQIFVAVMTRAFPNYSSSQKDLILLQNIASYMLMGCGVVYVVSGVLCIGILKRARQRRQISSEQAAKDLEELERRREELEQLLMQEN